MRLSLLLTGCIALAAALACTSAHSQTGAFTESNHYSPAENLERLDYDILSHAQRSVDIAMYGFTDKYLADELADLASRGVRIRLYRDHEQFLGEERRGDSTSDLLCRLPSVQIRVKRSTVLLHLKAYCVDETLLRDGSANWSPAGLKRQDNNARYTTDPGQVQAFERNFEEIWNRAGNELVR